VTKLTVIVWTKKKMCYTKESHGLEQNWGVNGIQIKHLWAHYWSNCRQGVHHLNL